MLNSILASLRGWRYRWGYGLLALLVAGGIHFTAPQPSHAGLFDLIQRGVQIIQIENMSDRQEASLGRRINDQMVGREFRLYNDRTLADYVNRIGQRLAVVSDRPPNENLPYIFQVVADPSINAFATMGGYVYVTTGLMAAADNEAQLASVIGHEIGHIASRHSLEQLKDALIAQGIADVAGLESNAAVAIGVDLALRRPNSRQDEYEADELGLMALTNAGYAPVAMSNFMQKLVGQSSPPTFLSTHPNARNRVERLNTQINDLNRSNRVIGNDGMDNTAYTAMVRSLRRT